MEILTTLERAIRLQKVELFSDLRTDELALVASIASQVHQRSGDVLFRENAPSDALFVVLAGRVEMSRGGQAMIAVGEDETVGNWAFFDDQPSVVTATAVEESWLLKIEGRDFFDLLEDHSEMTPSMFQALFKRVRSLLVPGLGNQQHETVTEPPPKTDVS